MMSVRSTLFCHLVLNILKLNREASHVRMSSKANKIKNNSHVLIPVLITSLFHAMSLVSIRSNAVLWIWCACGGGFGRKDCCS